MKINLNDTVKVKLTEESIEHLRERHDELDREVKKRNNKGIGPFTLRLDREGYYHCQLWSLWEIFAGQVSLGRQSPFIDNEIIIEGEQI